VSSDELKAGSPGSKKDCGQCALVVVSWVPAGTELVAEERLEGTMVDFVDGDGGGRTPVPQIVWVMYTVSVFVRWLTVMVAVGFVAMLELMTEVENDCGELTTGVELDRGEPRIGVEIGGGAYATGVYFDSGKLTAVVELRPCL
jgi:hypothetical protein